MIWLGSWEAEGVCATRKHFPFLGNSETNTSFLANLVLPAELLLNEWVGWGGGVRIRRIQSNQFLWGQ